MQSASVASSTHAFARESKSLSSVSSSITPANFIFEGGSILPSNKNGAAFIAPSFLTKRVVPPAPGKIPTKISGKPIFDFSLSMAKIR